MKKVLLPQDGRVLFQGDSITDGGRDYSDPDSLGSGYVLMAASLFGARHPERNVQFLNRGVSGNRTVELLERWQRDTVDLKPDVLTILIGINDVWYHPGGPTNTDISRFKEDYRKLLAWTREALPETAIILMEPFNLPFDEEMKSWRPCLDLEIDAVRQFSVEFETSLITLDGVFARAMTLMPGEWWSYEGIHPRNPGCGLIADQWLAAVE